MKKTLVFVCKFAVSVILAVAILSVFALVYYNPPKATAQPDKYTNSKFVSDAYWADMTEGMGYGRINNLGYNELDTFNANMPIVALIGSSHTEALQVPQEKTYTALLQQKLHTNGDENIDCVNLGKSGHFLPISVSNFAYFAEAFPNVQCAVIETADLDYSPEELEKMLAGEYHQDLQQRGGLYAAAQRIPYLRLLYKQYQDSQKKTDNSAAEEASLDYVAYETGVSKVMQKLSGIAEEKQFPLIILYHGPMEVQELQGVRKDDQDQVEIFRKCCEQNGIYFVDVTDRFVEHFNDTYELPYGFSNTTMGTGHLNVLGHSMIAEELHSCVSMVMEDR